MQAVNFKTDTSEPPWVYCTLDGRIDFTELAEEFGLESTSIKLNGVRFPKTETELKSAADWGEIRDYFLGKGLPVGAKDNDPVRVTGKSAVRAVSPNRSEAWIKSMLLPERPELPKNIADLTKVLFPEPHQKLPVSKKIYQ